MFTSHMTNNLGNYQGVEDEWRQVVLIPKVHEFCACVHVHVLVQMHVQYFTGLAWNKAIGTAFQIL